MGSQLMFRKPKVQERVSDIAELFLELPVHKPAKQPDKAQRRERKSQDSLVPDSGSSGDLVPDSWGGFDMA